MLRAFSCGLFAIVVLGLMGCGESNKHVRGFWKDDKGLYWVFGKKDSLSQVAIDRHRYARDQPVRPYRVKDDEIQIDERSRVWRLKIEDRTDGRLLLIGPSEDRYELERLSSREVSEEIGSRYIAKPDQLIRDFQTRSISRD